MFTFSIESDGVKYDVYGNDVIKIFLADDYFKFEIIIPRRFSDKLNRYPVEKIRQFLITHLTNIIDFIHSYKTDGNRILTQFNHMCYENDELIIEFFEDILSSLRHQTKSAC